MIGDLKLIFKWRYAIVGSVFIPCVKQWDMDMHTRMRFFPGEDIQFEAMPVLRLRLNSTQFKW